LLQLFCKYSTCAQRVARRHPEPAAASAASSLSLKHTSRPSYPGTSTTTWEAAGLVGRYLLHQTIKERQDKTCPSLANNNANAADHLRIFFLSASSSIIDSCSISASSRLHSFPIPVHSSFVLLSACGEAATAQCSLQVHWHCPQPKLRAGKRL
jgi:hypothetical protein